MNKTTFKVEVQVFPRPEILDPQGKAIASALERLGFGEVDSVRAGKSFELRVVGTDAGEVGRRVETMCEKLLANTIIEDYRIEVGAAEPREVPK